MVIERALRQHYLEAQMRLAAKVFENAGEGILVTDRQSKIITVNQAFTEITGYPPAEIIGQTLELLQAEAPGAESYRKIWTSLSNHRRAAGRNLEPSQEWWWPSCLAHPPGGG